MATTSAAGGQQLEQAYKEVTDRIGEAAARSGRRASDVVMVAVTKTATPDRIRALVEMGHADLGESRVQQLVQRAAQLEEFLGRRRSMGGARDEAPTPLPDVRWHMVGHLQRNKVKRVVPLARMIHSVDSLRVAEEIQAHAARTDDVVDVLIQVSVVNEPNKHGVSSPAVLHVAEQLQTMVHLRLRGLMSMAPATRDPEEARSVFARTKELFDELKAANPSGAGGADCNVLSMGMSDDFEAAVEEGANVVRIGRALFGEAPAGAE